MNSSERRRVLVVDDRVESAQYLSMLLEKGGFQVLSNIVTGEDAIIAAEEYSPHLVLMKIHLETHMTGIEAASVIIAKHNIPIIFLTEKGDEGCLGQAQEVSPHGYLMKPVDEYKLFTAISSAIVKHEYAKKNIFEKEKYHALFENLHDGMALVKCEDIHSSEDLTMVIEDVNSAFLFITGSHRESLLNRDIREVTGNLDKYREDWLSQLHQVVEERQSVSVKIQIPQSDLTFRVKISPVAGSYIVIMVEDLTDSVEAERKVVESEKKFRLIAESAQDGIIIMDNRGQVKMWNDAAETIFGYTREDIVGKNLHQVLAVEEDFRKFTESYTTWEKTGEGSVIGKRVKLKARHQDGSILTVEFSISSVLLNGAWHAIGLVRDVTENERLMENLKFSELFNRSLMNNIHAGIILIKKSDMIISEANPAAGEILEVQREDLIGTKCTRFFCPHDEEHCPLLEMKALKNEEAEIFLKHAGKNIHILKNCTEVRINDEVYFLESFINITDTKRAEILRKNALKQVQNLLTSIDSIIIGVSLKDRIIQWNRAAEKMFGMAQEDVLDKYIHQINIAWDWSEIYCGIADCIITEKTVYLSDIVYPGNEREDRILGVFITPMLNDDEIIIGFILFGRDVTEQRHLESRVMQNEKLKSIGELAAGIAHEINTPTQYVNDNTLFFSDAFAKVMNFLEMVEVWFDDSLISREELKKLWNENEIDYYMKEFPVAVKETLEGIDRISTIVKSMKSFAHPDGETMVHANVNKNVTDTVNISRNEWKYNAEMELHLDPDDPMAYMFPAKVNQVLLNLIVNASHAIHEAIAQGMIDRGKIDIFTESEEHYTIIKVCDNGCGIPQKIQDKIFDPFFTTKPVGKGTGQGLSLSYNIIVTEHEGELLISSEEGKGSCFTIKLHKEDDHGR